MCFQQLNFWIISCSHKFLLFHHSCTCMQRFCRQKSQWCPPSNFISCSQTLAVCFRAAVWIFWPHPARRKGTSSSSADSGKVFSTRTDTVFLVLACMWRWSDWVIWQPDSARKLSRAFDCILKSRGGIAQSKYPPLRGGVCVCVLFPLPRNLWWRRKTCLISGLVLLGANGMTVQVSKLVELVHGLFHLSTVQAVVYDPQIDALFLRWRAFGTQNWTWTIPFGCSLQWFCLKNSTKNRQEHCIFWIRLATSFVLVLVPHLTGVEMQQFFLCRAEMVSFHTLWQRYMAWLTKIQPNTAPQFSMCDVFEGALFGTSHQTLKGVFHWFTTSHQRGS